MTGEYAASGQLRLLSSGAVAQAATFRLYATADFPTYGDRSGRIDGMGTVRGSVSGGTVQAGLREPARAGTLTITGDLTWSDYHPGVIVTGTAAEEISRISVRGRAVSGSRAGSALNVFTSPDGRQGDLQARVLVAAGGLTSAGTPCTPPPRTVSRPVTGPRTPTRLSRTPWCSAGSLPSTASTKARR